MNPEKISLDQLPEQLPNEEYGFEDNLDQEVLPYINDTSNLYAPRDLGELVAKILDSDDGDVIRAINSEDIFAVGIKGNLDTVREAIKTGGIHKDAPWFKQLENKLIRLEIYSADALARVDLKKEG